MLDLRAATPQTYAPTSIPVVTYVRKQSTLKAVATIHLSKNGKKNNLPLNDGPAFVPMDVARPNNVPVVDEFRQSHHHLGLVLALEGMQNSLVAGW